jgi:hypothetical protein
MHSIHHLLCSLLLLSGFAYGCDCNNLDLPASSVTIAQGAGAPPTPTGGTITDGTYLLTALTDYSTSGSEAGATAMAVYRFSGTSVDRVGRRPDGRVERGTGTYSLSGTSITLTLSCGASSTLGTQGYSATATTLTLTDAPGTKSLVATLTKM